MNNPIILNKINSISVKDGNDLDSIQSYEEQAIKLIKKYSFGEYKKYMLKSEDGINFVMTKMMLADASWDPEKNTKKNSFRVTCGKFAILKYYSIYKNKLKNNILYLDHPLDKDNNTLKKYLESKKDSSYEDRDELFHMMKVLTKKEKESIVDFYLNKIKVLDIAKKNKVSVQAIYNNLQRGLEKLKQQLK